MKCGRWRGGVPRRISIRITLTQLIDQADLSSCKIACLRLAMVVGAGATREPEGLKPGHKIEVVTTCVNGSRNQFTRHGGRGDTVP